MKQLSGLYINHNQENYCILSDADTARAIKNVAKEVKKSRKFFTSATAMLNYLRLTPLSYLKES
ncbi:hypothetical protein [Streptococcus suis]|uniref:hypothetical protein n=1 Tax=Streptococcus suis TaxID=1307 RepID=UPI00240F1B15|nr:hypothetical protein [Streptococcus suis]MDG3136284.1 hypothetical protein [Streptococcus suis]